MKRKYSKQKSNSKQKGGDITLCKISKFLNKVINISDLFKKINLSFDYELEIMIKKTIKIVDKEIKNISLLIGKNNILEILNDDLYEDIKSFFDENYIILDGGTNNDEIDIDDDNKDLKILQYSVDNLENIKAISIAIICAGIFGVLIATPLTTIPYKSENSSEINLPFYHSLIVGIKAVVAGLGGFETKKIITKVETSCKRNKNEIKKIMKKKEFINIYNLLIEKDELMDELLQNEIFLKKIKNRIQQMNDTSVNNIKDSDEPRILSSNPELGIPNEINSF